MRTTVTLDDDVAAVVRQRQRQGAGVSAVINELARAGLTVESPRRRFVQRTSAMGMRIDVANVADALELLDGPPAR